MRALGNMFFIVFNLFFLNQLDSAEGCIKKKSDKDHHIIPLVRLRADQLGDPGL